MGRRDIWKRKSGVGNRQDPTLWVCWEGRLGHLNVTLSEVWGVTVTVRWKGREVLFASECHKRPVWRVGEWVYTRLEDTWQARQNAMCDEYDSLYYGEA